MFKEKLKNLKSLSRDDILEVKKELKSNLLKIEEELLNRKTWRDEILEATEKPENQIGGLFADEFNSCPVAIEEEKNEPINHKLELQKEMSKDVREGLLDPKTAQKINEFADNAAIYTFERNKLIVHKPEKLNIEQNSKTWFRNFLYQNYVTTSTEIKMEDMIMTYKKNVFSELLWVNNYGVRFKMDIKKYVHFLDNYVFQ